MGIDQVIAKVAEMLWVGGLAATPLAVVVSLVCRARRVRPATRHMLWFAVLASFVTPAVGSLIWRPQWFRSDRVMAAAELVMAGDGVEVSEVSREPGASRESAVSGSSVASGSSEVLSTLRARTPRSVGDSVAVETRSAVPQGTVAAAGPVRDDGKIAGAVVPEVAVPPTVAVAPVRLAPEFVGPLPVRSAVKVSGAGAGVQRVASTEAATPALSSRVIGGSRLKTVTRSGSALANESKVGTVSGMGVPSGEALDTSHSAVPTASTDGRPARTWLVRLLRVRDAVSELPPVPSSLWLTGSVLIVILSLWRRWMGMRWLRHATPAGPQVQEVVRQVSEALGLSRSPRVVFVQAAVSPMIWCGFRPLLVLPTSLWRTLDEDSRRAVLVHELAHVRRWDHVLCWLEAGIGAIYWWHPVVWWVRRRLHEEAEASCDTWVTTLFPANRRAYASALVVTKSFVSSRAESRGPWLGVASGSAKRLARRITMVMTHKSAPRMSMLGVFVTTLVVATGAFVMPGLACPPEDEAKAKAKAAELARVKVKLRTPEARAPKAGEPEVIFYGEAPALEAMRERGVVAPTPPTPPTPPTAAAAPTPPTRPTAPTPRAAPTRPTPAKAGQRALRAPSAPGTGTSFLAAPAPMAFKAPQPAVTTDLEALKVGREPREYRLSQGKLEAFYGMMSRNDVPILVQMQGDTIVIWGNDDEHAVFAKFVKIVDGSGSRAQAPARVRVNKADAELRARTLNKAQAKEVEAAEEAAQEYRALVNEQTRDRAALERAAAQAAGRAARADAEAQRAGAQAAREAAEVARAEARKGVEAGQQARELRVQLRELERSMKELEERAQRLEGQREKKPAASPGMMGPAATPTCEGKSECKKACEDDSSEQ